MNWSPTFAYVQVVGFLMDYKPADEAQLETRNAVGKTYGEL